MELIVKTSPKIFAKNAFITVSPKFVRAFARGVVAHLSIETGNMAPSLGAPITHNASLQLK